MPEVKLDELTTKLMINPLMKTDSYNSYFLKLHYFPILRGCVDFGEKTSVIVLRISDSDTLGTFYDFHSFNKIDIFPSKILTNFCPIQLKDFMKITICVVSEKEHRYN
jgi:hypothetical protein